LALILSCQTLKTRLVRFCVFGNFGRRGFHVLAGEE
jgi:hypothetical protein